MGISMQKWWAVCHLLGKVIICYCRASPPATPVGVGGGKREGDVIWTCEHDMLRVGGLSWGYVGPAWGYVGPSWGYVGLCLCAQSVVIYSILRFEMARTRVNTTVLVPKVAKTFLFTEFRSHHDLRFFWKTCKYQRLLHAAQTKNRFKKCKKCCNLQGSGPVTSKKLRKYQRFGVPKVAKTPLFTVFRAFHVCLKLQKHCKY